MERNLSVVIPAYNEEKVIRDTIIDVYISLTISNFNFEIIVVDDCSSDDTIEIVHKLSQDYDEIMFVSNYKNKGKGYSIRRGLSLAKYKTILVVDADHSVSIDELHKYDFNWVKRQQIIKGVRIQKEPQPFFRIFLGKCWKVLVWLKIGVYQDTQTPFLIINRRPNLEKDLNLTIDGFAYDIEVVKRYKDDITWVFVDYYNDSNSSVTFKKIIRMFYDLIKI